jgi:hypothetical protein
MIPGFADLVGLFAKDLSDAEDFISILRQANPEFASFYDPILNEVAALGHAAESWIQLSQQSFAAGMAGTRDSQITSIGHDTLNSFVAVPNAQDFGGAVGTDDTQSVQAPFGKFLNPIDSGGGGFSFSGTPFGMLLPVSSSLAA